MPKRYSILETYFHAPSLEALNELSQVEKNVTYLLSQASIAGYRVALFQFCPYPSLLDRIHEAIVQFDEKTNGDDFLEELKCFFVYLFSNYGVHFHREDKNNKKTPKQLGLSLVTPEAFKEKLGISLSEEETKYLFDENFQPTLTVSKDIAASGGAFHGKNMTSDLYDTLSSNEKAINAYHTLNQTTGKVDTHFFSANSDGVCREYLLESKAWLEKALKAIKEDRESEGDKHFDEHTQESLRLLIQFLESGKEEDFKAHSKSWSQMNNPRVEYNYGFIEYYDDPQSRQGTFQADVTVKAMRMDQLLAMIPGFEKRFPFPKEWMRKDMSILPNAASAHKVMGIGGLGPILCTIAYALPNYDDLRSEHGSKQVMYTLPSPSDVERYKTIYLSKEMQAFYDEFSPDLKLLDVVGSLTTTLHETIGHASGSLVPPLTNETKLERLGRWGNGLEEMRAEIIALYTAITFYDEIAASGIMGDWPEKIAKEKMFELFIQDIAGAGWTRWRLIPEGTTEITQAHNLADTGIMYFLIDRSEGGLVLMEDSVEVDGKSLPVLRLVIKDLQKVIPQIKEMVIEVQKFASTAPVEEVDAFMKKYAASTRDPRFGSMVSEMQSVYKKGVKGYIQLFPSWEIHENGDCFPSSPSDPFLQFSQIFSSSA